ncbi:acetyltransferase [Kandleria vitulina]|uniref:acetyltransferase n=1 Tax=Kandleria vitulina TaxID=1630 RepID=UPI00048DF34F|nr:acetyltransferase [Kandleria vitulina]
MQKKVVVIGASGHARVIADIIKRSNDEIIGFLDDNVEIQGRTIFDGKKVLGDTSEESVKKYVDCYFIIGIGSNRVRKIISEKYSNLKWYTAIHPNAVIGSNVSIGDGSVLMAGTVVNTGTKIGKHCIINTCSSIDHDNILEDYVHLSPGAHLAGTVKIGELTWICAGVTVINNISIGENNIIGAGATVIDNIEETNNTYVGVPVRKI